MNPQDPKIGQYLTRQQYAVAPVQFHNHDNVNSPPVSSATLSGIPILFGKGAPSMKAAQGTLFVRTDTDGSNPNRRMYINTDGNTTWAYFTASA